MVVMAMIRQWFKHIHHYKVIVVEQQYQDLMEVEVEAEVQVVSVVMQISHHLV